MYDIFSSALPYLIIALSVLALVLIASFVCFLLVFYSKKRTPPKEDEIPLPPGDVYEPFYPEMTKWVKDARSLPHEDIKIKSRDGLTLTAKYYEYEKGGILEILHHGYRGDAERDLAGGIERCFALGRNVLLVDLRAHGASDGRVISFGIKERLDTLDWVNYAVERFGENTKIILTGVSMGAATVMMAAGEELPASVVSVLADCGFSSADEIIKKVIRDLHLPCALLSPFVKLGAKIFGGFKLEENSPMKAMNKIKIPIIFIHGDTDDFVPHDMSARLFEACKSEKKRFVTISGAGHGLAYPKDKDLYLNSLRSFEEECDGFPIHKPLTKSEK